MGDGVVELVLQFGKYLTPSSPSISGQGCVRVELGQRPTYPDAWPLSARCEARRGAITLGGRAIQPRSRPVQAWSCH